MGPRLWKPASRLLPIQMSSESLVTVITPSLNQAAFLGPTLQSVADQDYPRIEHVVVDGGSIDGSTEILHAWAQSHPIRWSSMPDGGQADAILRGLAHSTGSIVSWLNSDDIYLDSHAISDVVRLFEGGAQVVTGAGRYLSADGVLLRRIPVWPRRLDHRTLRCVDWVLQPATFIRREILERHPLDTSLYFAFDWDLFVRIAADVPFTPIDREIAGYRLHSAGKTVSGGARRQSELLEVTQRYNVRRSARTVMMKAMVAMHRAGEMLPDPARRNVERVLSRLASLTQLNNGRGIPY